MKFKFFYPLCVLIVFLASCARIPTPPPKVEKTTPPYAVEGKVYHPLGKVGEYKEKGIASWYGPEFHGKQTSSGEVYNMYASTAAHRILPFGTRVQVTNLVNGRKTLVTINDRGPFTKSRIIDLSYTGAREIGLLSPGTGPVEIEVVGVSALTPLNWTGVFTVQIGAFQDFKNAFYLKERIALLNPSAHITTYETHEGKIFYQVRVGKYNTLEETILAQKELEARGFKDSFVVAE